MTKTKLSDVIRGAALFILFATVTAGSAALASSHREAPAISGDPQADNTDLYAWVEPDLSVLHIVANYIPLEEPSGGPNFHKFSDDVLYQIHIAGSGGVGDTGSLADTVTYNIRFTTAAEPYHAGPYAGDGGIGGGQEFFAQLTSAFSQTYTVTQIVNGSSTLLATGNVAPPNIGPRTDAVINATADAGYNDAFAASFITPLANGGKVWAGPRDDGFYVDLGGIFDLANLRAAGVAQDGVSGFNTHTIALDIPTTTLTQGNTAPTAGASDKQTIGIWASASRPKVNILRNDGSHQGIGPWVQVSRLGLPLINEAVIGLQDKDKYNRTSPATDVPNFGSYFLTPVIVPDALAVGVYGSNGGATAFAVQAAHNLPTADIINVINLTNQPTMGAHAIPLSSTGDVLRVDLGLSPTATGGGFPNGRSINANKIATQNTEDAPVSDVELSLLILGASSLSNGLGVKQGVNYNDKVFLTSIPWLALPWQGYAQGHGKPTP